MRVHYKALFLANPLIKVAGSRSKLAFKPLSKDDPRQRQPDIRRAKEKLD